MDVRHDDPELAAAELDPDYRGRWTSLVARLRKVMNLVRQARNESELHNWKGLHLEKLKGDRDGQYSIRINEQWRICFAWRESDAYDVEIADYH